jgi:hypothetical protein
MAAYIPPSRGEHASLPDGTMRCHPRGGRPHVPRKPDCGISGRKRAVASKLLTAALAPLAV